MFTNRFRLKHLLLEEKKKNAELRREIEELRRQFKVSDEDWKLGVKDPKSLAIKWMCVATNVKDYQADERIYLFGFIDRLLALDATKVTCFNQPKYSPQEFAEIVEKSFPKEQGSD